MFGVPPRFKVLEPALSVPLVIVHPPVKVCVKLPRVSVPPTPLIVSAPPFTGPANVAIPAVFVIETVPVVVKPAMLCVSAGPARMILELPAVKVPALLKSPYKVSAKLAVSRVVPASSKRWVRLCS